MGAEPSQLPWRLPLAAALLAAVVGISGVNQALFLAINHVAALFSDDFLLALTLLGNLLAGMALLGAALRSRAQMIWAAVLAAPFATLFVHGTKQLLATPRPAAVLSADVMTIVGPTLKAMSFPSGHTTTAFVYAAVVWALAGDRRWRALVLAAAVCVGLSRILVGAHWPVDVLAGAAGGWFCGGLGVAWSRRLSWTTSEAGRRWATAVVAAACLGLLITPYTLPGEEITGWLLAAIGGVLVVRSVLAGIDRSGRCPGQDDGQ